MFLVVHQHTHKPFAESEDRANTWTSINRQASTALLCQLLNNMLGAASALIAEPETGGADGLSHMLVALAACVFFALPPLMTVVIETKALLEFRRLKKEIELQDANALGEGLLADTTR